jgi:molybdopterin/thiamine biosynthesis adenylyltransferase
MTTATAEPEALPELTNDELGRYSRHLILPEVGMEGQQRLKAAKVLCVGTGGLGSPLALYLAAAGIGTLGLIDFDTVDSSNLQRQIIHSTKDIGRKKIDSAQEKLNALNPALNVVKHDTMLTSANALEIFAQYDIIADGTDNFQTRYLVNDACVLLNKPNAYGSIFRFEGQASVFATEEGPCYRCLYPEPPPPGLVPSCAEGGVLGILPGLVGVIQATEVIKLILGKGRAAHRPSASGRRADHALPRAQAAQESRLPGLRHQPHRHRADRLQPILRNRARTGAGGPGEERNPPNLGEGTQARLDKKEINNDNFLLLDVREPYEFQIAQIGGKLIPQNDVPNRLGELESGAGDPRPLPLRRSQPEDRRAAQGQRLPESQQRGRRHSRLVRRDRPDSAEVLTGSI